MISVIVDAVIIVLLAGSVGYGYLISRRVQALMLALQELGPVVDMYSDAVDKSATSVLKMQDQVKTAASEASETDHAARYGTSTLGRMTRLPGVRAVSDKKELVRMFFESNRAKSGG